uniref:Serpin domain-containing protein n=1 Tax=Timema poppense TaxID=170557 RepID=A0A7R9CHF2_TIMPO|nr:unnamed protein product [Timema poppensis]
MEVEWKKHLEEKNNLRSPYRYSNPKLAVIARLVEHASDALDNAAIETVSLFLLIARGQTAKEIADVLHLKYDIEELKNNALQIKNNMSGNPTKVGIVSALVASEGMTVSQLLISSAAQFFGVEVYSLNLRKHNEAVETINKWVKLKTARNIPTIMDPRLYEVSVVRGVSEREGQEAGS